MSQFQKIILAALSWGAFITVAWIWCWVARTYLSWWDPAPGAVWWGSIAAFFTQLILLIASIAATVLAANHKENV